MRVVEQSSLWFREGTSDKVYEVDLVEVATEQFVVNFRYGRRGSALRDGTKTATPVDRKKAKAIFDKLVAEKVAGGYKASAGTPAGTAAPVVRAAAAGASPAPTTNAQNAAIVARLRQGWRGEPPLHRAVWAATDRDLVDAEPALLELLDAPKPAKPKNNATNDTAWRHTVVSALVRCGTTASLPRLDKLVADAREQPPIRDVARLAIARIAPDRAFAVARALLPADLAAALAPPLERRDAAALARAAEELLATDPAKARALAVGLYLINDAATRAAVFAIVRVARLSTAEAQVVRALFRLAELRRDGELYVAVARRIDAYTGGNVSLYHRGPKPPMGPRTRGYFRRRVARALRRLARASSPDYVKLAGALLVAYSDADAEPTKRSDWGQTLYFDAFARYHALNDTLYGRSHRYQRAHHFRATWKCRGSYRPGGAAPSAREERFPKLWDAAPDALWRVLAGARATIVVEFAAKALRANRAYLDAVPDDALAAVLGGGHPLAQQFAFELARGRPMSTALARGALASDVDAAHAWVLAWIATHTAEVMRDAELLALVVTGKTAAIRDVALTLLRAGTLAPDVAASVGARVLAILLGLDATAASAERAAGAVNIMLVAFAAVFANLDAQVLRDLIAHPLAALGELGGELMLRHAQRDRLPADLLEALLSSPHAAVRLLGGRLLALTPPEIAKDDPGALVLFATSANGELREGTRTLLGEVARRWPDVGRVIADRLVDALLVAQPEGAPAHIVTLLRRELADCLPVKPRATIMKLIGALSPHAREAGGLLLAQLGPDDLGLDDLARLASHEILAIRRGAWALARAAIDRYRLAPVAVSRLVDSAWDDTRAFAIAFIRDELKTLPADAIIAICDSIRPEVQALGTQLLHAQFQTADAGRYLVRFAEHPSVNIQLLVSGMLEHHVAGDLERVRALVPYLITVLSQVNRGRVAKERVINLLRREAVRSAEAAALIAPILDRQSATIAVTQKHPLIATMVDVRTEYPDVALPIAITPVAAHPPAHAPKAGR